MTPASNLSKQNATITDHMCITDQERSVGGQCPVNHRSTTLKSLKCPENTKRKILWWRPRRRGELVQADKLIGVGCGGEAFIGAGETAIKTLLTGGKRRRMERPRGTPLLFTEEDRWGLCLTGLAKECRRETKRKSDPRNGASSYRLKSRLPSQAYTSEHFVPQRIKEFS